MFGRTKNTPTQAGAGTVPGIAASFRSTKSHQLFQGIIRLFQFLSATISLILFSLRLAKIVRLAHKASHSNGAVEGILAAAVLYTLVVLALGLGLKVGGGGIWLRILLFIFDLLFVAAFIIVAILTSPKRHGSSGPCTSHSRAAGFLNRHVPDNANCRLPWGTFILAIFSTLLHAITTLYHAIKDHRRTQHNDRIVNQEQQHGGRGGLADGQTLEHTGGRGTQI